MKISAKFSSLSAAIAASGIDLSYNEPLAKRVIRESDQDCREAYLMEDGTVWWVFEGGRLGRMLHKFSPFFGCISSAPLRPAYIEGNEIKFIELPVSKRDMKSRKAIADAGMLLG